MPGCSIRALWILNNQDNVVFSRRFPVVERRWRLACQKEYGALYKEDKRFGISFLLPGDAEIASAFCTRKQSEGSVRGYGIRVASSTLGSDSWVDDPITRHVISLHIEKEEEEMSTLLWPLILHTKGLYRILILPLVEPAQLEAYKKMLQRPDCGNSVGMEEGISSLLLDLPCITGAFLVGHVLGDIIVGDTQEPEVFIAPSPTVGGLLDSLTGSIGISGIAARSKPVAAPVATTTGTGSGAAVAVVSDAPRNRTPLDLNVSNILAVKANGFQASDLPPTDLKQPAWKPYIFRGKQRLMFSILETVYAAMYDRDEIPDTILISGQVNCRAELEGLPDVSFPLAGLSTAHIEVLSFHPCAQVPEHGVDKQALMFSPPLGNFLLMRYQAYSSLGPPVKGFYQLSMVSEDEGAFLFKLRLMEGYKSPLAMEFCTITMPFPRRKIVFFDGNPSLGTVATTEHSVEWKIIPSGRGVPGKSVEATFPGTIRFSPRATMKSHGSLSFGKGSMVDDEIDTESENLNNVVNIEDFLMEKMNKDLPSVDMEEPFCWDAYNYAKVAFKIVGGTLSGMSIDPKLVASGEYILWNTLGRCPSAASPKV
ncbi:AP-5 complex subunit mu [Nymphaea thermarum]|nr:AP-5 complex subunit mu [Nymphaea thermarum]